MSACLNQLQIALIELTIEVLLRSVRMKMVHITLKSIPEFSDWNHLDSNLHVDLEERAEDN